MARGTARIRQLFSHDWEFTGPSSLRCSVPRNAGMLTAILQLLWPEMAERRRLDQWPGPDQATVLTNMGALYSLYEATGGANWYNNAGWPGSAAGCGVV